MSKRKVAAQAVSMDKKSRSNRYFSDMFFEEEEIPSEVQGSKKIAKLEKRMTTKEKNFDFANADTQMIDEPPSKANVKKVEENQIEAILADAKPATVEGILFFLH